MYDNIEDELDYYINEHITMNDCDLVVFLENEEDKRFWGFIFKKSIPNKRIAYESYSKEGNEGKQQTSKYKDAILVHNGKALICRDSDFDYLINNNGINDNPFIFQTYTYSVENYCCCAESLNNLAIKFLLNETNFDFELFFKKYSIIIYELFLLDIFLKNKNAQIKGFYFNQISNLEILNNNGEDFLEILKIKIDKKISELKENYTINSDEIQRIKNNINNDTLLKNNFIHLYINGHLLFSFVESIFKKLEDNNHKQNVKNIIEVFPENQRCDKIQELNNNRPNINTALKHNFDNCYYENSCPSFNKIIDKIKTIQI